MASFPPHLALAEKKPLIDLVHVIFASRFSGELHLSRRKHSIVFMHPKLLELYEKKPWKSGSDTATKTCKLASRHDCKCILIWASQFFVQCSNWEQPGQWRGEALYKDCRPDGQYSWHEGVWCPLPYPPVHRSEDPCGEWKLEDLLLILDS